jgi:hypothetical protein
MARIRPARQNAAAANRVRDELEAEVINSGFLKDAPFSWIGLIIRYGLKDEEIPHYETVDRVDGELPMAIEIDVHWLLGASEEEMARVYRETTLRALVHAGEKYNLPVSRLKSLLADLT